MIAQLTREEFNLANWLNNHNICLSQEPEDADEQRRLLQLVKLNVAVVRILDCTTGLHWFKRDKKCIPYELARPFGKMETGRYVRATGEPKKGCKQIITKIHVTEDDNPICGYKPHKTLRFEWNVQGIMRSYVECKTCDQIVRRWGF